MPCLPTWWPTWWSSCAAADAWCAATSAHTVQTVTPTLAEDGSCRAQTTEWLVADVEPRTRGRCRRAAGWGQILTLNGRELDNARQFNVSLFRPAAGETMTLEVLRGSKRLKLSVQVAERHDEASTYAELASREENLIPELGIFAVDLTPALREQLAPGPQRSPAACWIAAAARRRRGARGAFRAGDLIYAVIHKLELLYL